MEVTHVDRLAQATADRYGAHLLALGGLFAKVIDGPNPVSEKARNEFRAEATDLTLRFALDESARVRRASKEVALSAVSDAQAALGSAARALSDEQRMMLLGLVGDAAEDVTARLTAQLRDDVRTTHKRLRNFAIQVDMLRSQRGWSLAASIIGVRERNKGDVRYHFVDRAGKRWQSDRYIRTLVRGAYLTIYNEAFLYLLGVSGKTLARVIGPEAGRGNDGVIFAFVNDGKNEPLPTYADIKPAVFHPNALNLVGAK
jgi:hypothetical protein